MKKYTNSQDGFTLIEVLIAITILAFLMVGIYTIVTNSVETKDRVLTEDKSFVQALRALERLQSDVAQAWSPLYAHAKYNATAERARAQAQQIEFKPSKFKATERFPFETVTKRAAPAVISEEKSEIIFFTASNRRKLQDSKQSRYAWVKHSLKKTDKVVSSEDNDASGEFEWVRTFQNSDLWEEQFNFDDTASQVLLRGVKSLEFFFWDQKSEKFVDRLRDSGEPDLLRVLKVKVTWLDTDGIEQVYERVMRPLWPSFDTKKDEEEKEIFRKSQGGGTGGGIAGGSGPCGDGGDNAGDDL
ncbi:MAG: hypothetical protein CME71_00710 [Halobacteriovorax sp.]|nr:hypothetical protein [Halobacteriovorax sp.]